MDEPLEKYQNQEHADAIEKIAAASDVSWEEVRTIYERVFQELQQHARIKSFLNVFTARRVKELLLARHKRT